MSTGSIRTLLALPEGNWSTELNIKLSQNGFEVVGMATRALVAWTLSRETCPDLVVVADRLAEDDGLTICRAMRAWQPTARVVLVAPDNEAIQMAAAQAGVTSCLRPDLPLPAWPSFLTYIYQGGAMFSQATLARLLAGVSSGEAKTGVVTIGPLVIDLACHCVSLSDQPVTLTPREFALLACLAQHSGQIVTTDQLLTEAWSCEPETGTPAEVRLYISRLRHKLGDDPDDPTLIISERGLGYRLRLPLTWRPGLPPCSAHCFVAKLLQN